MHGTQRPVHPRRLDRPNVLMLTSGQQHQSEGRVGLVFWVQGSWEQGLCRTALGRVSGARGVSVQT